MFGSRYLAGGQTRVLLFWHSVINKSLTTISNMFCNLNLTDMETCYKVFRTDLLKSIPIRSDRFGFEPEIVMKCAKRKLRIYEVPISYHGRTYEEGKKIGWKDGIKALGVILKFWLIDDLYAIPYGRTILNNLTGTPQYLNWLTRMLRPELGDTVLEVGAGIGNLAARLMARRLQYVAAEKDPLHLHALSNRFLRTPNVEVRKIDPASAEDFKSLAGNFDTALCVNVLEYLEGSRRDAVIAARRAQARRQSHRAGAAGPVALRNAGPQHGASAPVYARSDYATADRGRLQSGKSPQLQQGGDAFLVALQPRVGQVVRQQGDFETL